MSADVIQANYDHLEAVAGRFGQQAEVTAELHSRVTRGVQALEDGGWEGTGSVAFFAEMQGELYPAMQRLIQVLQDARSVTLEAKDILLRAEEEAAGVFNGNGAGASAAGTEEMGFLDHVGDFFGGLWDEGKDMVTGLVNMVAHPIDTAKGIAHAVTHPGEFWDAFKQPYVEAWESGHPWRAIGRGTMFVGSMLIGTKGADKVSKAAKLSRATRVAADAAEIARVEAPLATAQRLGRVAKSSQVETALGRRIAVDSTHTVSGADRVVLGGYKSNPARGFQGYIDEAKAHGGTYYSTSSDVWNTIQPAAKGGNGRGWVVNREFLQGQMERGVQRVELKGESISEVFRDPLRATSDTAKEIRYMQQYGYQYGYRQVGDTWVKVGDWRAGHAGRGIGGSVGPAGDLLDDAQSLNPATPGGQP